MLQSPLRVALVGCGAIAQAHATALARRQDVRVTVVCDVDTARAESLARALLPGAVVAKLADVPAHADAAVVAVPNAHHAAISKGLLAAGVHVLCEKPLAIASADADAMLAAARASKRVLSCGLVRRCYGSTELVQQILERGFVGKPQRFVIRESVTNWPMTPASFDRQISGGGVFIDMAPHVVDLLHTWFGAPEIVSYEDDAAGGVEASARMVVRCPGGVSGEIVLSRAYAMTNLTRILSSDGAIEVDPHRHDGVRLIFGGARPFATEMTLPPRDVFARQLDTFVHAISNGATANAEVAAAHVRSIERAYADRRSLPEPWSGPFADGRGAAAAGVARWSKILVTGASGSVGSRLIERWAAAGRLSQLRSLVRSHRSAARLHRFTPEIAVADLLDRSALLEAARGCDAVVHLGVGERARAETETLAGVCKQLGIRRFVHMSSAAVYGRRLPRAIEQAQEETPLAATGEPYADEKAAAERLVLDARWLDAQVLRPHMVYGPGLRWSGELMRLLPLGSVPIVDGGGTINLIHVDDLIDAVACALACDRGFGAPLFVSDGTPRPWSEYIAAHAALAGVTPPRVSAAAVDERPRTLTRWVRDSLTPLAPIVRSAEFRHFFFASPLMQATAFKAYLRLRENKLGQRWLSRLRSSSPPSPPPSFDPTWVQMQFSQARLSSERARREIGFVAAIDFAEGLRRTRAWFDFLGLTA
jgi:predicted dehydrogenase/nucleoside-diphosphate-sugar epimerase